MWRAVASLVCAVVAMALPAPALAQTPNGQLAVVLKDRIVAVNDDGTGLRPLYTPASGEPITGPAWSPDGNKLAFSYQDKINVLDLTDRVVTSLTTPGAGDRDVEPTWLRTGRSGSGASDRPGPRRPRTQTRERVSLGGAVGTSGPGRQRVGPRALVRHRRVRLPARQPAGVVRRRPRARAGRERHPGLVGRRHQAGLRRHRQRRRQRAALPDVQRRRLRPSRSPTSRRRPPRWAPDGNALAFIRDGQVLTVPWLASARRRWPSPAAHRRHRRGLAAVHGRDDGRLPLGAGADLQRDDRAGDDAHRPARRAPGSALHRPGRPAAAGRARQGRRSRQPQRLALHAAPRVRGAATSVTYRVSNGSAVSDLVRVTVFVVPRPARPAPRRPRTPRPPSPRRRSSARASSRRWTASARRSSGSPAIRRARSRCVWKPRCAAREEAASGARRSRATLAPDRVLALRLKLPTKPKGTLKTAFVTGTVRGQRRLPAREARGHRAPLIRSSSASICARVVFGFSSVSLSATRPSTVVRPITASPLANSQRWISTLRASSPTRRKADHHRVRRRDQLQLRPGPDRLPGVLREVEHRVHHRAELPATARAQRHEHLEGVEAAAGVQRAPDQVQLPLGLVLRSVEIDARVVHGAQLRHVRDEQRAGAERHPPQLVQVRRDRVRPLDAVAGRQRCVSDEREPGADRRVDVKPGAERCAWSAIASSGSIAPRSVVPAVPTIAITSSSRVSSRSASTDIVPSGMVGTAMTASVPSPSSAAERRTLSCEFADAAIRQRFCGSPSRRTSWPARSRASSRPEQVRRRPAHRHHARPAREPVQLARAA